MSLHEELERQGNWLFCKRSHLPILVLAACYLDFWHSLSVPDDFFSFVRDVFPHYRYFCLGVSLAGLAVRIHTVGHTPSGTSGRNTHGQVADTRNTTGFYSIIRHPLYFGNLLISLDIVLLTANPYFVLLFVLTFSLYYERIMYAEEQFLIRKFPERHRSWSRDIPAFFPKFSGWKTPTEKFSLKKVLRQEKNGLVGIFGIFALFHLTELAVDARFPVYYVLLGLSAASVLLYLALRAMKKSLLRDVR